MLNEVYKERFPKATAQMEEKLSHFIQDLEHVREGITDGLALWRNHMQRKLNCDVTIGNA